MKKFVPVLLLLTLLLQTGFSQTKVPAFGQFLTAEKELKVCEFDPEAEAVIILDKAESNHNDEYNLITKRRLRIKILKQKGIQLADVSLYYYSKDDFEFISEINAVVFNRDANGNEETKELDQNTIFDAKISEFWSEKKFALPGVRVGSIIEYEYTVNSKNYNGLQDWYFQSDLPVMLSSYRLVVIPNHEFAYNVSKSEQLPITVKSDRTEGAMLFEMKDIAALRQEPFMDARKDYLQKVEFQLSGYSGRMGGRTRYMTTWAELNRELMRNENFGGQIHRNVQADELLKKAKAASTPFEKMKIIYKDIQRTVFTKGSKTIYVQEGVKDAWKNKIGNSAEVNLLLINLLRSAGLDVSPLLVSERSHGKVKEGYPFLDQFNNVMAWVQIDNQTYILDASSDYTPPEMVPPAVVNTKAFLLDKKEGGIIMLEEKKKQERNRTIINAKVDSEGMVRGEVLTRSYDYAKLRRKASLQKSKEKLLSDFFTDGYTELKTENFRVNNEDVDSLALEQKFDFSIPLNASGEYRMLNLNMFSGFRSNPFISDIRFTDVNYGYLQNHEILELIALPEGWEPEELPKDFRMITPDQGITCARYIKYLNNSLNVMFRIEFNKSIFDSGEYATLKEFFKKMTNLMNEQVIIRKKN
ncbi:MAG: DUF3857 domain-containing protein [Pseudobacter sp.]|uniref:DUF3857 domain-containing protein n=1 Tax=Pseudobacter sp. TaxID=2045420 RepID=UPI003F81C167